MSAVSNLRALLTPPRLTTVARGPAVEPIPVIAPKSAMWLMYCAPLPESGSNTCRSTKKKTKMAPRRISVRVNSDSRAGGQYVRKT